LGQTKEKIKPKKEEESRARKLRLSGSRGPEFEGKIEKNVQNGNEPIFEAYRGSFPNVSTYGCRVWELPERVHGT